MAKKKYTVTPPLLQIAQANNKTNTTKSTGRTTPRGNQIGVSTSKTTSTGKSGSGKKTNAVKTGTAEASRIMNRYGLPSFDKNPTSDVPFLKFNKGPINTKTNTTDTEKESTPSLKAPSHLTYLNGATKMMQSVKDRYKNPTTSADYFPGMDYKEATERTYDIIINNDKNPKRKEFFQDVKDAYGSYYYFDRKETPDGTHGYIYDNEDIASKYSDDEIHEYLGYLFTKLPEYDEARKSKLYDKSDVEDFYAEKGAEMDYLYGVGDLDETVEKGYKWNRRETLDVLVPSLKNMISTAPEVEKRAQQRDNAIYRYGILAEDLETQGFDSKYDSDKIITQSVHGTNALGTIYHEINGKYLGTTDTDTREGHTGGGNVENMMYVGEKEIFNTLINAERYEDAYDFYQEIKPELEVRARTWEKEQEAAYAKEHPILAGLKTTFSSPIYSAMSAIDDLADVTVGDGMNAFDASSRGVNRGNVRRTEGRQAIAEEYGNGWAVGYDMGMTISDMVVDILIAKATGGLTGSAKIAKAASFTNMFIRSYASTADTIKIRGGSDFQAIAGGVLSGSAEIFTESFTWDEILNGSAKGFKGFVQKSAKEVIPNAAEELSAEFLGIVSDAIVMQDKSENAARVSELVMGGMTADEANKAVFKDNVEQIIYAGALGGVTGGVMAGGTSVVNYALNRNDSRNAYIYETGERVVNNPTALKVVVDLGLEKNNENFTRIADSMTKGDTPDGQVVGEAIASLVVESSENNGGIMGIMELITAIDGKSASYMGSMEALDTAKAVAKMVQGKATKTDKALISRSDGATMVLTALEGNGKAWDSVKQAAKVELRDTGDSSVLAIQNDNADSLDNSVDNGVRYKYTEKRISAVTTEKAAITLKDKNAARKQLVEYARENFPKTVINQNTKAEIGIARNGIDKFLSGNISKEKYATGYIIPQLIETAKKVGEADNRKGTSGIVGYEYYENDVVIDGDNYKTHIRVRNTDMGGKYYGHTISQVVDEIKIEPLARGSKDKSSGHSVNASGSNESVTQNKTVVKDGEVYSQGKKVDIPKGAKTESNIVLDEESRAFRKKNPEEYRVIATMAKDLGMKVKFVKGLFDSDGNELGGIIKSKGIFINTEADDPTRFAVTHEFGHRMRESAPKQWAKYQNYVIDRLKNTPSKTDGVSKYEERYEEKRRYYKEHQIDEEIACDYVGIDLINNVGELKALIQHDGKLAQLVRKVCNWVLDRLGLDVEKHKVQQLWRDAYREAMKNRDKGYGEGERKKSASGTRKGENKNTYTEKEYNSFGWARANNILNEGQNADYRSKFAMATKGLVKFEKTMAGEFIIPVSNIYEPNQEGINNVLVFAKGTIDNPVITSIIEIYEYDETSLDRVRRNIYEMERRGIQQEVGGIIGRYNADSGEIKHYEEYLESIGSNNVNNFGNGDNKKASRNKNGAGTRKSIIGTRSSELEDTTSSDTEGKFIPPGAEPRRDVKVPKSVKEGTKVRQFARTAAEAKTLTDKTSEGVLQDVEEGKFNYTLISDKSAMKNAYASLDTMGIEWVEKKVSGAISSHSMDKQTVAMAEVLMQKYSEEGQHEKAQMLIVDFAAESTRAAQSLQAISMLKKLDPNYEITYIDKVVENLREEIIEKNNKKKFGKKHSADIEVSEELKTKLMEAKTEEEREAIRDEIYTEIAEQLPDSWIDKWNAWRYMAMLGNARTHVRNVAGNMAFMPMIATKNVVAKIIEPIAAKASGGKMERSKTFVVPKRYRQFATKDAAAMRKELQGGGKHNPSDIIRDKKKVFDTKALEWMRVKVGESLEAEDWIFLKHHYKVALGNYLAANKIDLDDMSEATLDRARRTAIKEAQRNTYRDASAFANALSSFSKKNATTALLVEGLMPFKKTPINVLKRGVEYSPAGLVKAITTDLYKVTKGDMTASEYIDRICCSLTGTGVVALGMLLKSLGVVSGASDDDKEKEFDELTGVQEYSLNIGGHSYTLDWLAPFSLPFFTGVEVQNIFENGEDINFRNGVEVLSNMAEPFFEMSMLQGLTGAVDTVKQSNSSEITGNFAWNVATNYVGQSIPTLVGQVARTIDGTQRRSYDDKNKNIPSNFQYFVQSVMKKIPGLSQDLEPYVDEWGRQSDTGSLLAGALQNMLSPGYYSGVNASPMEKELKRLYGEVGNEDNMKIFPTAAAKKFNLDDGTEKNLTAEEYTEMQTVQGQTAYNLLTDIVKTDAYKNADDYTRGVIVSKVYEAASANARYTVSDGKKTSNTAWVFETVEMLQNGDSKGAMNRIIDSGIEKVEGEKFKDAKDGYKDEFKYDASQYSEAEIGIIDTVESDWAGYHASIDMGRELEDSDYKYIRIYEENLADEMPIEEYADVRAYVKTEAIKSDPEGSENNLSSKELQNYLDGTDYSNDVKAALFMSLGGSTWINPYTGLKNNGEPRKSSGGGGGSSSGGSKSGSKSSGSSKSGSKSSGSKTVGKTTYKSTAPKTPSVPKAPSAPKAPKF